MPKDPVSWSIWRNLDDRNLRFDHRGLVSDNLQRSENKMTVWGAGQFTSSPHFAETALAATDTTDTTENTATTENGERTR